MRMPACRDAARAIAPVLLLSGFASNSTAAITPGDPGPGDVRFTISSAGGTKAISPYIYGKNVWQTISLNDITLERLGGSRWSAYDWETNNTNTGVDTSNTNLSYNAAGANSPPGEAIRPTLVAAGAAGKPLIVTVPMIGYAAADASGVVTSSQAAPSSRWVQEVAKKSTIYPGSSLSLSPNKTDGYVFTDEFVNWVEKTKAPGQQVLYDLDNEPGVWNYVHPLLHPANPTFAEMKQKTIDAASAIKDVNPNAVVFGGVGYGWQDFWRLRDAPDAVTTPSHPGGDENGELNYYEWLMQQVHSAELTQGRKLMDVIDMHWYPEQVVDGKRIIQFDGSNDNSQAIVDVRVQAPRSLWDPTYSEPSWITACCSGPIKLLPRVQHDIDDFDPGTKMAISEYNFGGSNHISGGIAEADALGIFGAQGLYAAAFWSLSGDAGSQFVTGAFDMYRNYDGRGDSFGDQSVSASTDKIANSAVYASLDSTNPRRMVVVAINRTGQGENAAIAVTADSRYDYAEVYQMTSGSATPVRVANLPIDLVNAFHYSMPAYSVSTLVLHDAADGDFNVGGLVDGQDLAVLKSDFGIASGAHFTQGDNNHDGAVSGSDFLAWQRGLGTTAPLDSVEASVPEPSGVSLVVAGLLAATFARRRIRLIEGERPH